MPFLELDKLTKRFGDQLAVDGLSLVVDKGEFVTLLGPSGCGKTTTLQMIAGFVDVTSGSIRLEGRDLLAVKPARRGLGIVFQSYALFPHMSAAGNVAFGLEMQGFGRAERDVRVRDALALVGLAGLAERYPRRMSGGQQQRVALARALVIRPRILLLDEPLSNLDAKLREEMQIELRQIQRTLGTTTILVTHDQAEAMALSDRVVVMNRGRVEQIATPQQAYERPASPFVARFLGRTNELKGQVSLGVVKIATGSWLKPTVPAGEATLVVRPEKIALVSPAPDRLNGIVRMRTFQGNHWLYRIETPAGAVLALRQNSGEPGPAEGETVGLSWRTEDMVVRPRSEGL
ncbi:MAG: ABC transporter ATP-binding protein [Hyphomicrobiaceae bacterium]|nr:ABC transporter ATP-binding protein [Hyphomicrobiaceae bacterium]